VSDAGRLLDLQRLDDRLSNLRAQAANIEAELRSDAALDRARATAVESATLQRDADEAVSAAERTAAALRARAKQIDRQLYGGSVRNPQDLLTLQRELEDVRGQITAAEEGEFALMEAAESADAHRRDAETAVVTMERTREEAAGPRAARLEEVRRQLTEVQAERDELVASLPADHVALYTRVAAHRHPAVVQLLGDSCGGCRLPLGMREARAARNGTELVQCSNCDRIAAP
jgi:predicted  nucleic acid-binding Zn-ribbon protein